MRLLSMIVTIHIQQPMATCILLVILLIATFQFACVTSQTSPNIIFIITDDMGYADISAQNSEYETPHLDNLYEHSIVLKSHYIGLLCSPSRSQILTGRYAWNMGLSFPTPFGPGAISAFPGAFPTIADILREYTDYKSYALGKWHVGYSTQNHLALSRGFDEFHGFYTTGIYYTNKTRKQPHTTNYYIDWRANENVDYGTQYNYSTYVTRDKIVSIIDSHSVDGDEADTPFFIYAAFQAPHDPLSYVESNNMANCDNISDSMRKLFCLNVLALDQSVGRIVSQLKSNDLWDNTLVVFTSDNGGAIGLGGCNYPLRGSKGTFFEGAIRVITFVGGGYVPSTQRGTERDEMMHGSDWLPTIIGLATGSTSGTAEQEQEKEEEQEENNVNIETISNALQEKLYIPVAKRVALKKENNTENYSKYLVGESFDGIDLSEWLLNGDSSDNPRTNVGLSINSLSPLNNSVSIIFDSELTDHRYKYMYLTAPATDDSEYCTFCYDDDGTNKQRCKLRDPLSSTKLLFDLTIDGNESTNLITDSIAENLHMLTTTDNNVEIEKFKSKLKHGNKKFNYQINDLSDYKKNVNEELTQLLWTEAEVIVYEYQQSSLFNNYLSCQSPSFTQSNPANFGGAFSPFFSWQEYQASFQQICGDQINDVLLEMYLSDYGDY